MSVLTLGKGEKVAGAAGGQLVDLRMQSVRPDFEGQNNLKYGGEWSVF